MRLLERLADGPELVYLFWPLAMAYLRIGTHPSIFARPLEPTVARDNLDALIRRPHVRTVGEGAALWPAYRDTVDGQVVRGDLVIDSHIAALMREHGVSTVWTADRDFHRFDGVDARDPYRE